MNVSANQSIILTHSPLGGNYGGTLQAYALQTVLKKYNLNVKTHVPFRSGSFSYRIKIRLWLGYFKRNVKQALLNSPNTIPSPRQRREIDAEFYEFVNKYIESIDLFAGSRNQVKAKLDAFSTFIVGSDQVWRRKYVDVGEYMLDFVENRNDIGRVAYSASYGRDDVYEYSENELNESKRLLNKFDAISVRELSGVSISQDIFGVEVTTALDPTLLLEKHDYQKLFLSQNERTSKDFNSLFVYVLDENSRKSKIASVVSETKKLDEKVFLAKPFTGAQAYNLSPKAYRKKPIADWLGGIAEADFVVTDSFHGTVFSIIFNKPFISIGNRDRGLARFNSLLEMFGLEDRLVSENETIIPNLINTPIDWDRVNRLLSEEREKSFKFIEENIVQRNTN